VTVRRTAIAVLVGLALVVFVVPAPSEASRGSDGPLPASPHPGHHLPHGLLPAWRQIHDRIHLDRTTVVAGSTIKGTLIVTNSARRVVDLAQGCRPSYVVALSSPTYAPQVAFASTCNHRPFVLHPGRTKLPVKVLTTYLECTESGGDAATSTVPPCTSTSPPPLRPGSYRTLLIGNGLALPQPTPVVVTLTP
jgi:hypothetical protein